jgi:hypothetical protein
LAKGAEFVGKSVKRPPVQKSDHRHPRLLPLRRERPCRRRTAEKRDELAPFHRPMPPVLPAERVAHLSYGRRLLRCGISIQPMSQLGHSRRGRLLPVGGRLPLCPESGRKVMASTSVAMGQSRLLPVVGRLVSASVAMGQKEDITQLRTAGRSRSLDPGLLGQRRSRLGRHPVMGRLLVGISELQ